MSNVAIFRPAACAAAMASMYSMPPGSTRSPISSNEPKRRSRLPESAGPHTMENARRKAYTARSFRTSTAAYAKRFADNDPVVRQQVTLPSVIAIPGGLPERARSKPPLQSKMRRRLLRTKIPPRPRFRHPSLMRLLHGDQALECSKSASSLIRSVPEQQQKDNDRNGYAE